MTLSPFTPIFFPGTPSDGIESEYMQTFAHTDRILIQYFGDVVSTELLDGESGRVICTLNPQSWALGDSTLRFIELRGLSNGTYKIRHNGITSYPFIVTDIPEEIEDTVLFQYSMRDNRRRSDAVFMVDEMRYFFDFRVPGGFKDSEISFAVDTEDFTTPDGDPCNLYALESTQRTFTLGHQEGVPARLAELLNRLLTCSYVYVDGVRYARKEGSVPEVNVQVEGLDSFVYKVTLQRVTNVNPLIEEFNQMRLRRGDDDYRKTDDTTNRII